MFTGMKWWIEALLIMAVAAAGLYGYHRLAESYREDGRLEIRAEWSNQKLIDVQEQNKRIQRARTEEKLNTEAMAKIADKLEKDRVNEKRAYDKTIADLRSGLLRMRVIATQTKTIGDYKIGVSNTEPTASVSYETSEVRLPSALGISVIGIGSEANDVADQLRKAQEIILQDRLTCNGGN